MPPGPLGRAVPLAVQVFSLSVYTFKISRNAPVMQLIVEKI